MKSLIVTPIQEEFDCFVQGCIELGFGTEAAIIGRLPVTHVPDLNITVARGGLGKVQFAIQTQHLLDAGPHWDLVICAGAAGALVDELSPGDIVIATETVEHDIRNKFGKPLLPRYVSATSILAELKGGPITPSTFNIHFGPIASGDEDVVDVERRREIHLLTGALAVAWEGAGGARACHFSGVPFIEIRGITDQANSQASADFEMNLASAMRHIAELLSAWSGKVL
jgi:adenosylhomocysteine nucleosidase